MCRHNKILVILHFFLLVSLMLLTCTYLVPVQIYTDITHGVLALFFTPRHSIYFSYFLSHSDLFLLLFSILPNHLLPQKLLYLSCYFYLTFTNHLGNSSANQKKICSGINVVCNPLGWNSATLIIYESFETDFSWAKISFLVYWNNVYGTWKELNLKTQHALIKSSLSGNWL